MAQLPANVREAREDRDGPVILATLGEDGIPNIIYATCVSLYGDQ